MLKTPKFTKTQYTYISSVFKTISEGIVLGSSAAYFLPEALQIENPISLTRYLSILIVGLLFLIVGVILAKKGTR